MLNKPDHKEYVQYSSTYMKFRKPKAVVTESRSVAARGKESGA